ncbi:unnamed protein product [Phaedon cochleariae]|uniref:Uncharacterized protein n=1 Tax=Phaedon cochleariae TaxID=80249 RepID=A0A9N9SGL7_PHACE|nr:unnamed protein product [Phaedon cochleariae]
MVSRYLGGMPISLYANFCTRAVQDMLSTNLRLLKTSERYPDVYKWVSAWSNMRFQNPVDYESLIKDPQCLPLRYVARPENILKREVQKGVSTMVINCVIKALFCQEMEQEKATLIEDLMCISPVDPRLLNKLYSLLSNPGLQEKYLGKFSNTRSIQQVAFKRWTNEKEVLLWVKRMESILSNWYKGKEASSSDLTFLKPYLQGCTMRSAHELRSRTWGITLEGITMPAQQEQTTLHVWRDIPANWRERAILIAVDGTIHSDVITTRGKRTPYFGSHTRLRAKRAPLQVLEVETMVESIKQLMELHSWVKGSESLTKLIETMIIEKTSVPLNTLTQYSRLIYSGTISHRLSCPALRRGGMANQSLAYASHCVINSDTATKYAKQGTNYTICFQSAFLYGLSCLSQYKELGVNTAGEWALVLSCEDCTAEIPEELFTMSNSSYAGVALPINLDEITPEIQTARIRGYEARLFGARAYSVMMARKFVIWMISSRNTERVISLENKNMEEAIVASFVNLTEFKRLDCSQFLSSLLFYFFLYNDSYYRMPDLIVQPLLESGDEKIAFDVLIDSLLKCDLFGEMIGQDSSSYTLSEGKYVLRELLADAITKQLSLGTYLLLRLANCLTLEDTEGAYVRCVKLQLVEAGHLDDLAPYKTKEEIEKYVLLETRLSADDILPIMTCTEEEATAEVILHEYKLLLLSGGEPNLISIQVQN